METYSKSQSGILLFMGKWKTLAIALTLLSLVVAEAPAGTVTFTHKGNGSGTLDGIPFPASDFVVSIPLQLSGPHICPQVGFI